jgi:hypothetical protein
MKRLAAFIHLMGSNKLSSVGAALVTACFIADVLLIVAGLSARHSQPYLGIFSYLLLPGMIVFGLFLIPIGIYLRVRKLGGGFSLQAVSRLAESARIGRVSRVLQVLLLLTLVNLMFFAIIGYEGYQYTESTAFCGQLCHQVMEPEFTTYSHSPHSKVLCVDCHIGPGAGWFVKSKLSGVRQVFAVLLNTYPRPIPTPVENLRPAREVCEVCHRPSIFTGNRIKVIETFEKDRDNTRLYTVLNLRVGHGGDARRPARGIHWHVSNHNQVRYYATDIKRQNIVWVQLTRSDGSQRVWIRPESDVDPDRIPREDIRLMDCVDCHNRPTHIYLPPDVALNERMADGSIDPSIPWIRRLGEEVLVKRYETTKEAMAGIATLASIYEERYPEVWQNRREDIEAAIKVLQEVHALYVYPDMNVQWNTYPSLIGHPTPETPRCFRCHDGVLRDSQDEPITLDCDACHYVLATRQKDPAILKLLRGN